MPREGRVENLVPQNMRTKEEQREVARKGGIASGKARRERKTMRETALYLLSLPLNEGDIDKIETIRNVKGKNITAQDAIVLAQLKAASNGDIKAAQFLRETIGENPVERVEVTTNSEAVQAVDDFVEGLKGDK